MEKESGSSPQAVSLPVGGGGARGLGENFQPDLNTGTGNYSVPLELLPGIGDFQPNLALMYSTGAGNSAWGVGWSLPIPAIRRRTFRGIPSYDDALDSFLYGTATELFEISPRIYRASVESAFERIARSDFGWEVTEKSGISHFFGRTTESRIEFDDSGQTRVFSSLIDRTEDTAGNAISYHYRQDGSQRYLSEVRYAIYTIRFEYESRPDPYSEFLTGFELRSTLRCSRIRLHVQPLGTNAVRSWHLEYEEAQLSRLSLLSRVTLSGHEPETGAIASMPPLEFSYTGFEPARRRYQRFTSAVGAPPPGLDQPNVELVDLDGLGLPGVVAVENGQPRYWSNRGSLGWKPPRSLERFPAAFSLGEDRVQMADMDGNGAADLLVGSGPFSGYFENHGNGQWESFIRYRHSPGFDIGLDEISLIDIDGDGIIDAVRSGSTGLHVYHNRGAAGWESPHLVPKNDSFTGPPDVTRGQQRVRLANMNGDGLLDVVQISAGRIEYWPSRGNGRYGASRVMANPPDIPYPFDPSRVLLTDITGDGLSDVIYVGYDEVTYWINQSGNGFSAAQTIRHTPPTPNLAAMRVADMNATGTAGLIWTAPYTDYRYLDFTGGVKPGLLHQINDHLGQSITIEFGTSTQFALADEADGRPWSSFLPFPVQVVASVVTDDNISGMHTVTQYRYHEGHYDGHRREFDGFAQAEQIEVGDESIPTGVTVFHFHTEASARALVVDPELRRTLKRKLHRVEAFGRDGSMDEQRPFHVEESFWSVRVEHSMPDGRRVLFPHIAETSVITSERENRERIERHIYTYDDHGNVVTEQNIGEETGDVVGSHDDPLFLQTTIEYALNVTDWVMDRPARILQRDKNGALLNEGRYYYDGPEFLGLPLGEVGKGQLSRTEKCVLAQETAADIYGTRAPDFSSLGFHSGIDADGRAVWLVNDSRRRMDTQGNVVAVQDGRGNTTSYTLDDFDLFVTRVSDAKGITGHIEHNYRVGKPHRQVNPNGGVSEFRYDPLGRTIRVALPGDTIEFPTTSYVYNTTELPVSFRSEYRVRAGETQTMQLCEYLDGSGEIFQQRSEHDGNVFIVSGRRIMNARGKPTTKLEPFFADGIDFQPYVDEPNAPSRIHSYDALGRPVETINQDGGRSTATFAVMQANYFNQHDNDPISPFFDTPKIEHYDSWYRLVAVEELDQLQSSTTRYQLDELGRLVQVTDARGTILTLLDYDMLGRKISVRHLDAGQRRLAYDAAGNMVLSIDALGNDIVRTHDELNRLLHVRYDGEIKEQYAYDNGVGSNLIGHLAHVIDPTGETTLSYDVEGRITDRSKTVPGLALPITFRYVYDRLGRVTTLTYPDNVDVNFDFYSGSALRRIPGYVDQIEYSAAGIRSSIQFSNGVRTDYLYDTTTLRLTEIQTRRPATEDVYFHCQYSAGISGNIDSVFDLRPGQPGINRSQSFEYDAHDRLTLADGFDSDGEYSFGYTFDKVGNFLTNPSISQQPLTYDDNGTMNRLVGIENGSDNLFGYDANGHMTTMPDQILSYNSKHELTLVERNDRSDVRFSYDYNGNLARREFTSLSEQHTSHFFDNVYELQDDSSVRWVFAGDLRIAREDTSGRVYLHNDHLDSTVVYTDSLGNRVADVFYLPYGGPTSRPTGMAPFFTSKRMDADIGLYYFRARWYAPEVGRFITPDPLYLFRPETGLQDPIRLNPYAYVGNNPVRFVDPSGMFFGALIGLAAAAIHAAVIGATAVIAYPVVFAGAAIVGLGTSGILASGGGGAALGAITHRNDAVGPGRGALLGLFTGLTTGGNVLLASRYWGATAGGALGIVGGLGVFPKISQSEVYQGFLGWSSYLMPLSWPTHAIGLTMFSLNVDGFLGTIGQADGARIQRVRVDWTTGNILTVGGWVGNLNTTAFNLGAFSFANPDDLTGQRAHHESGHMLNNAAFGAFHSTTAIVTMPWSGDGSNSQNWFWERVTESNVNPDRPDRPEIPWWG